MCGGLSDSEWLLAGCGFRGGVELGQISGYIVGVVLGGW